MDHLKDYRASVGSDPAKFFKSTIFQSKRLLLGLNCLEMGQEQNVHSHADQDKFYLVLEGQGAFTVDATPIEANPGEVVWAPAGVPHGVINRVEERLVLLVGIAPAP